MSITRRCDYACRIIRAAYKNGESFVSIAEVAEAEQIPYSFARSIQHELVKAGLLRTIRGVHGGLVLNCDPSIVTVYDVLKSHAAGQDGAAHRPHEAVTPAVIKAPVLLMRYGVQQIWY